VNGAWPRLLGKCLFTYFGGSSPAIRKLVIEDYYDQIPDDVLECWASCLWALQAVVDVASRTAELRTLMPAFQKLGANIYALTGLRPDEFLDARVAKTFDAFSQRFAQPLKLDPGRLLASHQAAVASLRPSGTSIKIVKHNNDIRITSFMLPGAIFSTAPEQS
jgi:hypothetical protein